jgi:hypothetical protein
MFGMSALFGIGAWFAESSDRAGGMTAIAVFSTFGFMASYLGFYFG